MKTGSWYSLLGPKTCHASTGAHSAGCKVPRSPSTLPTLCNQAEYFAFFLSWAYSIPSPRGTVSSISSTNFPAGFHSNMSGHSVTPPSSIHLQEPGTWVLETGSTPDFLAGSCDLRLASSSPPPASASFLSTWSGHHLSLPWVNAVLHPQRSQAYSIPSHSWRFQGRARWVALIRKFEPGAGSRTLSNSLLDSQPAPT